MCAHKNTIVEMVGEIYFVAGQVVDALHEEIVCLDCGAVLDLSNETNEADESNESDECQF